MRDIDLVKILLELMGKANLENYIGGKPPKKSFMNMVSPFGFGLLAAV